MDIKNLSKDFVDIWFLAEGRYHYMYLTSGDIVSSGLHPLSGAMYYRNYIGYSNYVLVSYETDKKGNIVKRVYRYQKTRT